MWRVVTAIVISGWAVLSGCDDAPAFTFRASAGAPHDSGLLDSWTFDGQTGELSVDYTDFDAARGSRFTLEVVRGGQRGTMDVAIGDECEQISYPADIGHFTFENRLLAFDNDLNFSAGDSTIVCVGTHGTVDNGQD